MNEEKPGGGPVAPAALMVFDEHGRVVATVPEGGITLLDQFALAALDHCLRRGHEERLPFRMCTDAAYKVALQALESRKAAMSGQLT